jgi:hypothetical protein
MPAVTINGIAEYLQSYVAAYRKAYDAFVMPAPVGGGYSCLPVSAYLDTAQLHCFVARDGCAIADISKEPEYRWEIAGGPAFVCDEPDSRIEPTLRANQGVQPIGLYRIVAKDRIPENVWRGELGSIVAAAEVKSDRLTVRVEQYDSDFATLLKRLTFGAFGLILNLSLPDSNTPFWQPLVTRELGFVPADRNNKRFFHLLELSPHLDEAAWDPRTIPTRVAGDLRRDFVWALTRRAGDGSITYQPQFSWSERLHDRLRMLGDRIAEFARLLHDNPDADESVFHTFLNENPILLDVYGDAESKPRFTYPEGESPLGKLYVEPDFILRYPNQSYKLVELERPSRRLATRHGEPRAEATQPTFQIAEWRTYIQKHASLLEDMYPGIAVKCRTMLVIGRSSDRSIEGRNVGIRQYIELLYNQFRVDEILTYDDLLQQATGAYARLAALTPSGIS